MSTPIQQALDLAQRREVLPLVLGTADIRRLERQILDKSFWSARTAHTAYLKDLKKLVDRYVQGEGYNNDLAQLRVEARKLLTQYGYTPEKGFPGDELLGIPPASAGSLRDLSSERRLNLIFETQASLMRGRAQKLRGMDRQESHPAWELVRYVEKRMPREWPEIWQIAANNVDYVGVYAAADGRMIARKDSPIWAALGSSALFDDALNVDHPPFAFNSGMGWLEVSSSELRDMEAPASPAGSSIPPPALEDDEDSTPPEDLFIGGSSTLEMLAARLRARQAAAADQAKSKEEG